MTKNPFTSDLRFLHRRVCEFTDLPWTGEENTERLIDLWNRWW